MYRVLEALIQRSHRIERRPLGVTIRDSHSRARELLVVNSTTSKTRCTKLLPHREPDAGIEPCNNLCSVVQFHINTSLCLSTSLSRTQSSVWQRFDEMELGLRDHLGDLITIFPLITRIVTLHDYILIGFLCWMKPFREPRRSA